MALRAVHVSRRKIAILCLLGVFLLFLSYFLYVPPDIQFDQANEGPLSGEEPIHIFIPTPATQLIGMMALINSIRQNTEAQLKFHLLTDTQESADHITTWMSNSVLHDVDKDIIVFNASWIEGKFKVPKWEHRQKAFSQALPFARYFIPKFLSPDYEGRAVYLDDDIIVQGDIRELAWTKMKEYQFAALSPDCNAVTRAFSLKTSSYGSYVNLNSPHLRRVKIPWHACKLNSGVIVVDVGKWKRWKITDKLLYWTELNKEEVIYYYGADQAPIMIVCFNRFKAINPLWHVRDLGWSNGDKYSSSLVYNQARLLHWNGERKPWKFPARRASDIWRKYYVPDSS